MALKGNLMILMLFIKFWERFTEAKRKGDICFGMLLLPLVLKG